MERIHAVTFAPFCARGTFEKEETRQSLKLMKEKTGANYVIFAPNGVQKTAFSETIDYRTKRNVSDEELTAMIAYAKQLGLKVALKPTANCEDGTWRAHINFFDEDVVCEPRSPAASVCGAPSGSATCRRAWCGTAPRRAPRRPPTCPTRPCARPGGWRRPPPR